MGMSPQHWRALLHYIEGKLEQTLDVDQLCQQLHLSKYHFHRQCSAYFGIPVMSLVKQLRLKQAAYQLAFRHEIRLLDIALASGYSSHEAFTRAFKQHFGCSPSEFRSSPDWAGWHAHNESIRRCRNKMMQSQAEYTVQLVEFPTIQLAVLEHHGPAANLGHSISRFIEWRKLNQLPPRISRTFNLIYDDPQNTAAQDYRFDLACSIESHLKPNDHGVITKQLPGGLCAQIRHTGSDDGLEHCVRFLYAQWLPNSIYAVRDFPLFFERVSFFPDVAEHEMVTDIYLPIEAT